MKRESFHVQQAKEEDVSILFCLIKELAAYEQRPIRGTPELLRRSLFEVKAAEALLVEINEEKVGYVIYLTNFSSFDCRPGIWLEDVYVRPEHRGKGAGRELLRCLAMRAMQKGYERLEWHVLEWNVPALDFYAKLGAQRLDDWCLMRLDDEEIRHLAGGT